MSDKKEGAIYQCDAGHWYVQSVGSGPGSWSLPFVGCPVCKLQQHSNDLGACRKALGVLSMAVGNPALEFGDVSLEEALAAFVVARLNEQSLRLQASEKECERLRGDSTIHWRQIDLARIKELEGILGAALEAMKIWIEGGASRYPYDVMAQLEGTAVERHELK